jgi:Uri superfamily endonuclease
MKPEPGTYILVLQCKSNAQVEIGKWGRLDIEPGYYLYVGSAFGPGGLKARVGRHVRTGKAKRWHIDYLREYMALIDVWYSYDNQKLEHQWAQALIAVPGMNPIKGFGCSDCQCYSHLFRSVKKPVLKTFVNKAGSDILQERITIRRS